MIQSPAVSFVISTFNRRDVLLGTLARLGQCGVAHEVFVVDNASGDGTAAAVRAEFPEVELIALTENRGSCAKNMAIEQSRGECIVFLDDDSFPVGGAIERMVEYFQTMPALGAAVFTVTLPDGSRECSAYPDVFIGCGVGFRREALIAKSEIRNAKSGTYPKYEINNPKLTAVGGLPEDFFMQAEEYDLSLRLLDAGWQICTFEDLHVTHLKTPGARFSKRVTRLDVRNNLVLIARYFPEEWVGTYLWEWSRRYWVIAASKGHRGAFVMGLAEAIGRMIQGVGRRRVSDKTFEQFAKIEQTRSRLARYAFRRVLFADYGKNMVAYRLAAEACGMEIIAIADSKLSGGEARYHGIPIVDDQTGRGMDFDAVIVSNLSRVHAKSTAQKWRQYTHKPVIDLFENDKR